MVLTLSVVVRSIGRPREGAPCSTSHHEQHSIYTGSAFLESSWRHLFEPTAPRLDHPAELGSLSVTAEQNARAHDGNEPAILAKQRQGVRNVGDVCAVLERRIHDHAIELDTVRELDEVGADDHNAA